MQLKSLRGPKIGHLYISNDPRMLVVSKSFITREDGGIILILRLKA